MRHTIHLALCFCFTLPSAACGDGNASNTEHEEIVEDTGAPNADTSVSIDDSGQRSDTQQSADTTTSDIPEPDADAQRCTFPDQAPAPGLVATAQGYIQGQTAGETWSYLGVPYVAPPVDALRWQPPQPALCHEEVFNAHSFGPKCPQLQTNAQGRTFIGEEDCLSLNLWTPSDGTDATKRPVMVFIHGGGNIVGSSSQDLTPDVPIYNGRYLAERGDVVVVTFNYRIGPLGFLALPQLSEESPNSVSGNYGNLDQIAALTWVQHNIEAFGGDPDRVMVFGESAGSINTCVMLTSGLASGLFHRALMQSSACPSRTLEAAESSNAQGIAFTPCAGTESDDLLSCLRGIDPQTLIEAIPGSVGFGANPSEGETVAYGPVVDGWVLKQAPLDVISAGEHNHVPFTIGSNADEMASRAINPITVTSVAHYEGIISTLFGTLGEEVITSVLEAYPASDYPTPNDAYIQLTTDAIFTCPVRTVARAVAKHQEAPTYRYFFSRRPELRNGDGTASHGIELLYLFRTLEDIRGFTPAQEDLQLADAMMDYWIQFARGGDPNPEGTPVWPLYSSAAESSLVLDASVRQEDGVRAEKCDVWDDILGRF